MKQRENESKAAEKVNVSWVTRGLDAMLNRLEAKQKKEKNTF